MSAVLIKIKADLTSRPMVSALVLLTITASATLLTLAVATLMHMSTPYDQSFRDLNAAHVWLFFDRALTSRRDIARIEGLAGVTGSTGLRPYVVTRLHIGENRPWVSLRGLPEAPGDVNRLLVTAGQDLASVPPHHDACLVSKDLDDLYSIGVGTAIGLTRADGKDVTLPVAGLAYNPMWDTYRSSQPPYVYVSEATLRRLFPDDTTWGWSLGLRLADPEAVDATVEEIERMLHAEVVTATTDWHDVKRAAAFGARINFIFLGAFSGFAILATILVIASSVGSIVLSQFRQIGILKTVGFTRRQVLWLYLGQYLLLTVIGSALGLGAGVALAPLPLKSVAASLSTPFRPPLSPLLVVAVLAVTGGVVAGATLSAALRGANANIVRSVTVGAEPPRRTPGGRSRQLLRLGVPIVAVLGIEDAFARPLRSFLTGLNLVLGVTGIVFGLTLSSTLDTYRADPALLGIVYDAAVTRQATGDTRTRQLLRRTPGVAAFYGEYRVDAETAAGQTFQVRVVDGALEAFPFHLPEGRLPRPDAYEAVAGRGLLDWLGLSVGDTLTVTFKEGSDRPTAWRIVGQYPEPVNVGQMMMVGAPSLARQFKDREPDTYFLKLAEDAAPRQVQAALTRRSRDDLNVVLVEQALPDAVFYLQAAIYALSAILIGIALVNVFNTSLLSTREKVRSIAVLKTIGMTPAQVVAMVNVTAATLGLVAVVVGTPLGYAFTRVVLAGLSGTYGFGNVHITLNAPGTLLLIPLMLLVSVTGSLIPSLQAARGSIVEVIHNE